MLENGELLQTEGFHRESGLYLDFAGSRFLTVRRDAGMDDARKALETLYGWVETFPFSSEADRAAYLSGAMTAVLRPVLPTAPMLRVSAHSAGSGKGLLCDGLSILQTGKCANATSFTPDENEMRKRMLSLLREGSPNVLFDNVSEYETFKSDTICSVLTQEVWGDRILGVSQSARYPTKAFVMCNGNNLRVSGDMLRRVMSCEIDPAVENPEDRKFSRNFLAYTKENRAALHNACLTTSKAYLNAGGPELGLCGAGSFDVWDKLVRQALFWVSGVDCLETARALKKHDGERETLRNLLEAWHEHYGVEGSTIADAIGDCSRYDHRVLRDLMLEVGRAGPGGNTVDARKVAWWLRRNEGVVRSGLRFWQAGTKHKVAVWAAERVELGG